MKHPFNAFLRVLALFAVLFLLAPAAVQAHPGHTHPTDDVVDEFDTVNVVNGIQHPFTGLDHLIAALAVGCLAFAMGGRGGLIAGGVFMGSLAMGYAAGRGGIAMPMREAGLALSVLAMGIVLFYHHKSSAALALALIAGVAFWHGNAHGVEGPGLLFGLGLWMGTAMVVAIGAAFGSLFTRWSPMATRYAGAAVAFAGLCFCGIVLLS